MRTAIIWAIFGLVVFGQLACDEPKKKAYVEGHFEFIDIDFNPKGSLARGGASYYGSCTYTKSTERFQFEVGDVAEAGVNSAAETYIRFNGIVGPATEGVYSDAAAKIVKEDPDLRTVFGSAVIKNGGNRFAFEQPEGNPSCYVNLLAKAVTGEVTKIDEKKFNYYVALQCTGLTGVEDDSGTPLTAFNGHFFFKGCK